MLILTAGMEIDMEKQKSIKRHRLLKYWVTSAQQQIGIVLALLAAVLVFQFLFSSSVTVKEILMNLPIFAVYMGVFVTFISVITDMRNGTYVSVAFGGTRREAFRGQQLSNILRIIEIMLLYVIMAAIAFAIGDGAYTYSGAEFIICLGILLIVTGIVQLLAAISLRIGGKALVILFALCGGAGGFMGGFFFSFASDHIGDGEMFLMRNQYGALFLGIGVIAYVIGSFINYRFLRKYEVR